MHVTIVIPTYWGQAHGQPASAEGAIFDHPTPVDGESTLPRLLDSLAGMRVTVPVTVCILAAAVVEDIRFSMRERVKEIIDTFEDKLDFALIDPAALPAFWQLADSCGFPRQWITLGNYAGVRNLQLMASQALGSDLIVALDDDEVVKPDYLEIALQSYENQEICGAAGYYEDAAGSILLREPAASGNLFQDKAIIMNEAARTLQADTRRWVPTSVAFGGNMLFKPGLFTRIGFDPGITRGEDLDYVMNARLDGFAYHLDKQLRITHLPPYHYDTPPYLKLAEDVRRFIYERTKLQFARSRGVQVPEEVWMPYPGKFFTPDLVQHALHALSDLATDADVVLWGSPEEIVGGAEKRARKHAAEYFDFAARWPVMMTALNLQAFGEQLPLGKT
jgi:hypothetical protein